MGQKSTLTMKNLSQKRIYHGHNVNANLEANLVDVNILAGADDTWRVFFAEVKRGLRLQGVNKFIKNRGFDGRFIHTKLYYN